MDETHTTYIVSLRMQSGYYEDPSYVFDSYEEAHSCYLENVEKMQTDHSIAKVKFFSEDGDIDMSEVSPLN